MGKYPRQWGNYDGFVNHHGYSRFNFEGTEGDVNRFGARFRLASSFKGLELEGYKEQTQNGYGALCRIFLCWSAYEVFLEIMGLKTSNTATMLSKYQPLKIANVIKSLDVNNKFYNFIYERVNKKHKAELDLYFNSDPCNPQYLASAIRHIFAHGPLTPNANEVEPKVVVEICDSLSEFLLTVMDSEFSSVIEMELEIMANEH
ncbi:hypothetical protein OTE47_004468 [Vibrio vulnificus]|nr:hypothetical protein [Vibrio vulnificus]EIZ1284559.1 hypothetical protein [Vibrio vulnificus]EJB5285172.1 hypothetical protein [Vibrio vulnificus]EKE1121103.1 hypothetical protein [Vibrio vulnificus]EME0140740.1 hypothetical protein [Vibrio vulnificus]